MSPVRGLTAYVALGVAVLVAVALVSVVLGAAVARRAALDEAASTTDRLARLTVAPLLPGALAGQAQDRDALDLLVETRLRDGALETLVVWEPTGTIVYSSDADLVGRTLPVPDELARALAGETVASIDDDPETREEGTAAEPLVEVYSLLSLPGDDLVLEVYYSAAAVQAETSLLRRQILIVAVGGLVLLQGVQIPIAVSMARRIRRDERATRVLTGRILAESERERRTIAADLHDGPVQEIAGVTYALGALRLQRADPVDGPLDEVVGALQSALASLRRLMVDVYPPDLGGPALPAAVADLARRLESDGVQTTVTVQDLPPMAPEAAAIVFRTARELLSNVSTHSGADHVWVRLSGSGSGGGATVTLTVADDGVGLPASGVDRRADGHLGLRLVLDRVADAGGRTLLGERDGGGAEVVVVLPAHAPDAAGAAAAGRGHAPLSS